MKPSCTRLLLGLFAGLALPFAVATGQAGHLWTLDADFDQGTLLNVNHDAPGNDQLQLNATTTPLPFIAVACSARGTLVRIDTVTGDVLGEYASSPDGMAANPSRTTVDLFGNVWCGNRDEASDGKGSIVKVGIVIGGTRVNADGTPNPNGEYLAPPFAYSTAVDRDSDGLIHTSRGLADVLAWPNISDGAGGPNGLVEDALDECILVFQRTTGPNTRHVSVDANNDVYTCGYPFAPTSFDKLDGDSGAILQNFGTGACGGYGGLVDGDQVLWSAGFQEHLLMRRDLLTNTVMCLPSNHSYGLGIDTNGFIWNANYDYNTISKFAPDGSLQPGFPRATGGSLSRGVAVTTVDNHVWVANTGSNNVSRLDNAGNLLKLIPVGSSPTGVAVDALGKVWVTNLGSDDTYRIDPVGGLDSLGEVDLIVPLGAGAGPYNYSDMTGVVAIGTTAPQGTWTVVHDGGLAGAAWGTATWNSSEPPGTAVKVELRAADSVGTLPIEPFVEVVNGVEFAGVTGRYVELRTTLSRDTGVSLSPILYDLALDPVAECWLVFGTRPTEIVIKKVHVLLTMPYMICPVTLDSMPILFVPKDPAVIGIHFFAQVYMFNPTAFPSDPIKLSNGLDIEIGVGCAPYGPSSGLTLWAPVPVLNTRWQAAFSIDGF